MRCRSGLQWSKQVLRKDPYESFCPTVPDGPAIPAGSCDTTEPIDTTRCFDRFRQTALLSQWSCFFRVLEMCLRDRASTARIKSEQQTATLPASLKPEHLSEPDSVTAGGILS